MKATVFSSSGRGPYSFVCMSTLSLQMDCLTLLYSLQSCSTCWAVSAACPHEQRSVSPTLNILWMWYFSRLCPVLSLKMVVWPRLFRQYTPSCLLYSGWLSFHLLFRLLFIMDFTYLYFIWFFFKFYLFGFLTSSSTTKLYRRRAPRHSV